jgi:uroporphyrinogen-III synthase
MRPLIIVRPEPGASATASAARAAGLDAVIIPLFEIRAVDWQPPDPSGFHAVLLTSANALRHGGTGLDRLTSLPAHCVGQATAAAARDARFVVRSVGGAGVDELLQSVAPELRLLHLCGADRKDPAHPRQIIESLPVYEAVELSPELREAAGAVVALHSPRAASAFARNADSQGLDRSTISLAAISPEAAAAAGPGWKRVEAAAEPSDAALLAIASHLCNNLG